jgi:ankyrin repeat protein
MDMKTKWIGLAFSVCLLGLICSGPCAQAQEKQDGTAAQQFLDSIRKGDMAKVQELLKDDASLIKATTRNGTTPVLLAIYAQHRPIADFLLTSGVELNIFEAAAMGQIERVRGLLEKKPELIHAYSPDGWTALHLNFGNAEVVKLLLDKGADINAVSKNRLTATPLQGAAAMRNVDLARLLIGRGANVNCRGEEGTSPLHEAAGNGDIELAKLLLAGGADVKAKDDKAKTPLAIAMEYKQPEIAKLLREHGATE